MILSSEEMPFAETKSLRMRAVREGDINKLAVLIDDPRTQRTGPDYIVPRESALIKALPHQVEDGSLLFAILEAKTPADDGDTWAGFIGLAKPRPVKNRDTEMSICIAAKFWGKGLGTEATRWVVDHAFKQLGMHRVSLEVLGDNDSAIGLYKFVGFKEEGRIRKHNWKDGQWVDTLYMGILDDEWQ